MMDFYILLFIKQSLDNVSRGSSISPHESINRHIGENEQSQANTHQDT